MSEEKFHISFSALETFNTCPRKYYYNYVIKLPKKDRPWFVFGNFNHLILEKFFKYVIYFRKRKIEFDPKPLLYRAYESALRKFERLALQGLTLPLTPQQLEDTKIILKNFYDKIKDNIPDVLYVEKKIEIHLTDDIVLIGYLDRVDRVGVNDIKVISVRIVDYKTSKKDYPVNKNIQLDLYAVGLRHILNDKDLEVFIQLDFIKTNTCTDPNIKHDNSTDESLLDSIRIASCHIKQMKETSADNPEAWQPIDNEFCWSCDFKRRCYHDRGIGDKKD